MNKFITLVGINSLLLSIVFTSVAFAESHITSNSHTPPQTNLHKTEIGKDAPFWSASEAKAAKQEALLLKTIEQNPESKVAHANLANLYLANNKTKKAIGAYQNAIIVDPNNAKLFAGLSIAYLHQSKYSMAKAMAEQAVELDPNMEHAKKIQEYITKKEAVIAQASSTPKTPITPMGSMHQ